MASVRTGVISQRMTGCTVKVDRCIVCSDALIIQTLETMFLWIASSQKLFAKFWPWQLKTNWNEATELVSSGQGRLSSFLAPTPHLVEKTGERTKNRCPYKKTSNYKVKWNYAVKLDIDTSPGSMGRPVKLGRLKGAERRVASDGWRLHAFNE